jgi:hypothetical protein
MAEQKRNKQRQPNKALESTGKAQPSGHRHKHPVRVFEEGQDEQRNPRPRRKNLSGTPLGSDPRE